MTILNEGEKNDVSVGFYVNDMPLQTFKKFKRYAKDWRDNYSVTIQVLLERSDMLEYYMTTNDNFEIEEIEDEVQTLGDN